MPDPIFRIYEPWEGTDTNGYPLVWHDLKTGEPLIWSSDGYDVETWTDDQRDKFGIKDLVRTQAGHRCIRCGHTYTPGCGIWGDEPARPQDDDQLIALFDIEQARGKAPPRRPLWSPCDEHCTHLPLDEKGKSTLRVISPYEVIRSWQPATNHQEAGEYVRTGHAVQASWRILTVHHISGVKTDLRWWNLAALCQRCHLQIQRKVIVEQIYPAEHTDWFKPYAAGFYAYRYLGEDLSRAEVMERFDELLALERVI